MAAAITRAAPPASMIHSAVRLAGAAVVRRLLRPSSRISTPIKASVRADPDATSPHRAMRTEAP